MKRKKSNKPPEAEAAVPDGLGNRAARHRPRRGRRILWAACSVVAALALVGAAWFVTASPLLRVSFVVRGLPTDQAGLPAGRQGAPPAAHERLVSALTALAVAKSPALATLGPDHLFMWMGADDSGVRVRVDNTLIVAASRISVWERLVTITATARAIAGVWCPTNQAAVCYGFDEDGVLLAQVPRTEGSLILVITDESGASRVLGQRIMPNPDWVGRLRETLGAVRESGEQAARIAVREQGLHEWVVTLISGPEALFSFDFVPQDLAAALRKLKLEVSFDKVSSVDFRVPGRLYYR